MLISTEKGDFTADSFEEIEDIINRSREIWISGDKKFPCLALLINKNKVCVNYFGTDETDMWLSRTDTLQSVEFIISGAEWLAPEDSAVTLDDALKCVKEFISTYKKPRCIDWQYGV